MLNIQHRWILLSSLVASLVVSSFAQEERTSVLLQPGESLDNIVRKAATVVPSARQLAWQNLEFIAFIHFGMNTFMDQEWGRGTEDPRVFNPADLDARQWVRVIKEAGMKLVILTAKHHDGFCLWPSKFTVHSVKYSPWRKGKGDVVREVSRACREAGLKFGVYLSPWDRHEQSYGDSPLYNQYFLNQLRELLTGYGEISEVWFDGANAEGPNGKRQIYDWQAYYRLIRELQQNAVIAIMGPDVRWVGTESGYGRETEWSVLPNVIQDIRSLADTSQRAQRNTLFVPRDMTDEDLGSRSRLATATSLTWYPAETDVSIRPGWFYHQSQDNLVKSPAKLVDIYYSSVGRNSVLLLNIPPDRRGRIAKPDINSLVGMRKILDQTFSVNLARGSRVSATSEAPQHPSASILDDDVSTYWTTASGAETAVIIVDLRSAKTFDRALLAENIAVGQRIESFHLEAFQSEEWIEFARGTTVGYKRLLRFPAVSTRRVRIVIEGSRLSPTLSSFGLYKSPPVVRIEPAEGSFEKSLTVHLSTETPGASIYYTLDGTSPTETSTRYDGPIVLTRSATVTAVTTSDTSLSAETSVARFAQCIPLQSASLTIPPSIKYPGDGTRTIIDGKRGSLDFQDKRWLGFHGDNVDVVVDLGRERSLRELTIGFLQQQGSWIFLPKSVRMFVSSDSLQWKHVADLDNPLVRSERVFVKDFSFRSSVLRGRFIRFTASNIGTCPSWHAGSGDKAWLFVDEVLVR